MARACREVVRHGTDLGRHTVTKHKHFKRLIRARMEKTGESYTTARLHLLETAPVARQEPPPDSGQAARVRLRARKRFRPARRPLGLQYFAPAFGIVISLAIGVVGFMTITTEHPSGEHPGYVTEGQP